MKTLRKSLPALLTASFLFPTHAFSITGECVYNCGDGGSSSSYTETNPYTNTSFDYSYSNDYQAPARNERLEVAKREREERLQAKKRKADERESNRRSYENKLRTHQSEIQKIKDENFKKNKSKLLTSLKTKEPPSPAVRKFNKKKKKNSKTNQTGSFFEKTVTMVQSWTEATRNKFQEWAKGRSMGELIKQVPIVKGLKSAWDNAGKTYEGMKKSVENLFGVSRDGMNKGVEELGSPESDGSFETEYNDRIEGQGKKTIQDAESLGKQSIKDQT